MQKAKQPRYRSQVAHYRRDWARSLSTFRQRSGTTRMPAFATRSSKSLSEMPLCSHTTCGTHPFFSLPCGLCIWQAPEHSACYASRQVQHLGVDAQNIIQVWCQVLRSPEHVHYVHMAFDICQLPVHLLPQDSLRIGVVPAAIKSMHMV